MQKIILFSLLTLIYVGFNSALAENKPHHSFKITDKTELIIEQGDITRCAVKSIVNAANPQLLGGAGVCGAIFKAAGWDSLQQQCDQYPETNGIRCPVGQARITESCNLKTRGIDYIIHAVGPDCRIIHDEQEQNILLKNTYNNSLILADQHGIASLAFPFISSAIYAFPKKRAALIALDAIRSYAKKSTGITSIHFVLFSQEDYELFCAMMQNK